MLAELLDWAELVVVNGEGSIHHNLPRALALLAVVHVAHARATPVHVVNSTLYAMDERVLEIALGGAEFVHVREPGSARVLAGLGIPHALAPDLACLALPPDGEGAPPLPEPLPRECLVTAGVCAQESYLERLFAAVRVAGLDPVYLSVGDGGERALAERVCARLAVPLVHADAFELPDLARWLAARPIAVSGRHHLNLLLLAAGVPFVPLPTNTCKIEATLELLEYPLAPAGSADELERALAAAREARDAHAADARRSAERARRAVLTLVDCIPSPKRA